MSADFWAGYLSGAIGIVVGNPLDLIKVRLQARTTTAVPLALPALPNTAAWATGTAAPILGYGALNALLFVSYNRTRSVLDEALSTNEAASSGSLTSTWLAGAVGGLATWVVSAPTELIKCRAQVSDHGQDQTSSSAAIARRIWREQGIRGFYFGGLVTALRDSIGYGFYFASYEWATSQWPSHERSSAGAISFGSEAPKVLLCGGLAGVATWASVFPLDVIKTRVQTQPIYASDFETSPLLQRGYLRRVGAWEVARDAFREHGTRVFFRGFTVCCLRAFIVNAVQWMVYEGVMHKLTITPDSVTGVHHS
jgi:solute carrier family 25 (mitochondrial carnitine/acylcarnitine transporter), member 20/29